MAEQHRKQKLDASSESIRTGLSEESIRAAFLDNLFYVQGRFPEVASLNDKYKALAYTVRDRLLHRWVSTVRTYQQANPRTVCYLSAEYLPGPFLGNNLLNLGIEEPTRRALAGLGIDLDVLIEHEEEPGPGQRRPRPPGRLLHGFAGDAADSGDQLRHPLRVRHLQPGHPRRRAGRDHRQLAALRQSVGGAAAAYRLRRQDWRPYRALHRCRRAASACAGFRTRSFTASPSTRPSSATACNTVNLLRLWSAEAAEAFDFHAFNRGDYYGAVVREVRSETISKVLYPNDEPEIGKRLRLLQQHFFVTCSLQDMLRIHQHHRPAAGEVPREIQRAAQRHAPGHRRGRTDAPAGRRAPAGLGRGLERDAAHLCLHQPHPAARGAGEVADTAVPEHPAAPPRNHLRDQRPPPRRGAPALSLRQRRACSACRSSTRPDRATCAWHIWPASAASPSTAWPNCTAACSRKPCCATSTSCGRRSSRTRPTASRRAAS